MVQSAQGGAVTKRLRNLQFKRSYGVAFAVAAIAVTLAYRFIDLTLSEYFHAMHGTLFIEIAQLVTKLGSSTFYIVAGLLLWLFWRKRKPLWSKAALLVFSTAALSGIIVNILKVIFGRARPKLWFEEQTFGFQWFEGGYNFASFPSGHSATALSVFIAFALIAPRFRAAFITLGILVACSRVVVTAHYVSDVIAGGFVGALTTLILYQIIYPKERA